MWKIANPPTSGIKNSQRSSTSTNTVPSTVKTTPKNPPSTPPTPFLRSKSEVRFALDTDFAADSEGEASVPPLPPIEPAVSQPVAPANNIRFSPNPNGCYRVAASTREKPSKVRFAANPNDCYRLDPRHYQLPTHPGRCEDGASIPLRGQYAPVFDEDDPADDEDLIDDPPPGLDEDVPTAMLRFAWAYAKGLGGLVMGVMDGVARGTGGD